MSKSFEEKTLELALNKLFLEKHFSGAAIAKALLMEGNDHINAEDTYLPGTAKRLN